MKLVKKEQFYQRSFYFLMISVSLLSSFSMLQITISKLSKNPIQAIGNIEFNLYLLFFSSLALFFLHRKIEPKLIYGAAKNAAFNRFRDEEFEEAKEKIEQQEIMIKNLKSELERKTGEKDLLLKEKLETERQYNESLKELNRLKDISAKNITLEKELYDVNEKATMLNKSLELVSTKNSELMDEIKIITENNKNTEICQLKVKEKEIKILKSKVKYLSKENINLSNALTKVKKSRDHWKSSIKPICWFHNEIIKRLASRIHSEEFIHSLMVKDEDFKAIIKQHPGFQASTIKQSLTFAWGEFYQPLKFLDGNGPSEDQRIAFYKFFGLVPE